MKVNIYVVFDKLAVECGPVFESVNDDVARRAFKRMISGQQGVNLDEYELTCIGQLNKTSLSIVPEQRIVNLNFGMTLEGEEIQRELIKEVVENGDSK